MNAAEKFRARPNMLALIAALLVVGVISLSVHVTMLQVLGVPFPEDHAPVWAKVLNLAGTTTALIAFQVIARNELGKLWRTVSLSGLILFMLKEGVRGAVMNGVVTTGWVFALSGALTPMLLSFGIAAVCALAARRVNSPAAIVAAGLLAGGLSFVLQITVGMVVSPVMASLAHLARPDVYHLPYPPAVLVPAYVTFIEPVLGCGLMVALCWGRLPGGASTRLAVFTLLVVLLKGVLLRTFLYPAFMELPFALAVVSQSQFLLEFAILGALTALAWRTFGEAGRHPKEGSVTH